MNKVLKLIVSIAVSFLAGGIGSLATMPNIASWYAELDKPALIPPNEVFGPVWTTLYLLMGISLYLVWTAKRPATQNAYIFFGTQLALNTLWSVVFFGLHLPWIGVIVIVLLLAGIIMTMREFAKSSRVAMLLLLPYLLWVGFATYLTIGVAVLN